MMAGLLEVCWAIGLKYTQGFTKPLPSLLTILAIGVSMYLLAKSSEILPISTAYSVWVGIGAIGTTLVGVFLFHESFSLLKIVFLTMLLTAIIGLKMIAGKM